MVKILTFFSLANDFQIGACRAEGWQNDKRLRKISALLVELAVENSLYHIIPITQVWYTAVPLLLLLCMTHPSAAGLLFDTSLCF